MPGQEPSYVHNQESARLKGRHYICSELRHDLVRFFYLKELPINQRFTLGRDQRLKSRKRIERIFREGKSMHIFPYRVYYMLEDSAVPGAGGGRDAGQGEANQGNASQGPVRPAYLLQAGFGAGSRHFKKAVDRNRIKRLTREAYRLNKGVLSQVVEERRLSLSLFFVYTGKELPEHELVSGKIAVALEKIVKEVGS